MDARSSSNAGTLPPAKCSASWYGLSGIASTAAGAGDAAATAAAAAAA
eukprot:CAMPEP_0174705288 /NCGR_PEP_ID=MMETSP1094-20130205/8573_1 /TAXON_ID=156173 /ORGANISM="Chrysochromulina brevifilum, Strain UTEX LB 985" /LENGTH=47 /DNA_ID= /DNA_START= /DNA_END= /DNA_ORIENTATION=